jgi:NhaP-type Na+/H+ or K+/H+ antiporter
MLQGITFGVVLFTLLIQATTAEFVINRWGKKPTRPPRSNSSSRAASKPKATATAAGLAAAEPQAADSTNVGREPVEPPAESKPSVSKPTVR